VLAAVLLALFKPAAAKASVEIVGRAGAVRAKDIAAHRPGRTWYVVEADADASPIHAQRAPADGNALGDSQPPPVGLRQWSHLLRRQASRRPHSPRSGGRMPLTYKGIGLPALKERNNAERRRGLF